MVELSTRRHDGRHGGHVFDHDALSVTTVASLTRGGLDDRTLRRAAEAGRLTRAAPGTYVDAAAWSALTPEERHRAGALLRLDRTSSDVVASHETAATLHGLPLLGPPPQIVHVIDRGRRTSAQGRAIARHAVPLLDDEVTVVDGVAVTTPARTALNLCLGRGLHAGVVALDHGLRHGLLGTEEVRDLLTRRSRSPGRRAALVALDLADASSASPLESASAVTAHLLGAPRPERQRTFRTPSGTFVGTVDFWWPEQGAVGEADGRSKYLDPALRDGRSAGEVVVAEKHREDALRRLAEVRTFGRWGWADALDPRRLAVTLTQLGVPLAHPPVLLRADTTGRR